MFDAFRRKIRYLRISVTDRCNLRCRYCMPQEGITLLPHDKILSFEEIAEVVRAAVPMGIDKLRLTGGEPLVRAGIVRLIEMLARIEGISDLAMTTNGIMLEQFAQPLAEAGLRRVNVSLDTLDSQRYAELTRGGDLARVLSGIEAAKAAGLDPIKLNCVVRQSPDEPDARQVAEFGLRHGFPVRFIRQMNLAAGDFSAVEGGLGGICSACDRLRLSSDGMLRPCLFNDLAFSVRKLGPEEALRRAIQCKPERGMTSQGSFYALGG